MVQFARGYDTFRKRTWYSLQDTDIIVHKMTICKRLIGQFARERDNLQDIGMTVYKMAVCKKTWHSLQGTDMAVYKMIVCKM